MLRPLAQSDLFPAGALTRIGRGVCVFDEISSTNAFLLENAAALSDGTVACADYQTAGRGRLGRQWLSPRRSSIMLSIMLRELPSSHLLSSVSLVMAVAACEAIQATTSCLPGIHWPNDIVIDGKKVAGILAESVQLPGARERAVVVGIGINCYQHTGHFPPELAGMVTSLDLASTEVVHRAKVAEKLLSHFDSWISRCENRDEAWNDLLMQWKRRSEDIGKRVTLTQRGIAFDGTVIDICENGDLDVQLDRGGRQRFEAATTTRHA